MGNRNNSEPKDNCLGGIVFEEQRQKIRMKAIIHEDLTELANLEITVGQILDRLTGILYLADRKERPEYIATEYGKCKDDEVSSSSENNDPPKYTDIVKFKRKHKASLETDYTDNEESIDVESSEYKVTSKLHNGEDNCLICNKSINIVCYSILKGGETLKFELMSLHYISHHNYFNLRLSDSERSAIKDVVSFLEMKPGKSYYMKKETCKVWDAFIISSIIEIGTYTIPSTNIEIKICTSGEILKKNKKYFISKYLPHYKGDSDAYVVAELRNYDVEKLLKEVHFVIQTPHFMSSISAKLHQKKLWNYYMPHFMDHTEYSRREFWPEYVIESRIVK